MQKIRARRITACILPLALLIPPLATAGPAIEQWQSSAGSKVLFVAAPALPMIDLQLVCDAGSARDGDQQGVAMMTNELLFSGTTTLDADAIAAGFDDLGAQVGSSVGNDMAMVSLRSLSDADHLQPALKLFTTVIGDASYPAADFERERNNLLIGLQQEKQNPGALARRAFFSAAYGDHPYATMASGTEQSAATLQREQLLAFKQRYYSAANCLMVMVGDLDQAKAEEIANQVSEQLAVGDGAPALPAVEPSMGAVEKIAHPSQQTHVLIGQPVVRRGDPDHFALFLGNHVLGGSGLRSRISQKIREERGLAYSAYSYFSPMRDAGPLVMGLQTRNDQADEAAGLLRQELEKFMADGPSDKELTAAKQNLTGGFPLRIDSNGKIIGYLAVIGFYDLPLDYLDSWTQRINAISAEQIRDAYARRVDPDRLVEIRVGGD
ncbi:MAG: pitrilysin family protein [Gammaproteobacteria bacterium]